MHCHGKKEAPSAPHDGGPVVLVGNPNVGKSVLFGLLTRRYVTVSNYPGTTVEVARGLASIDGCQRPVIDTPGVNSLLSPGECERVTRSILLDEEAASVVLVADAKNLQRALILATQLAEMEVPFVLTLNMDDEAQALGIRIDAERLSEILRAEVVRTVATRSLGVDELRRVLERPSPPSRFVATFDDDTEEAIRQVMPLLPPSANAPRWLALMLLTGHEAAVEAASPTTRARATIQTRR